MQGYQLSLSVLPDSFQMDILECINSATHFAHSCGAFWIPAAPRSFHPFLYMLCWQAVQPCHVTIFGLHCFSYAMALRPSQNSKMLFKIVHMNLGKSSQQTDVRITADAWCMIRFIYVSRFLVSNWLGQGRERLAWNWDWILGKTSGRSGVTNESTSFSCIPSTHVSMSDITQLCNILYNHFQTGRVV